MSFQQFKSGLFYCFKPEIQANPLKKQKMSFEFFDRRLRGWSSGMMTSSKIIMMTSLTIIMLSLKFEME